MKRYEQQSFDLGELNGLSAKQIEEHLKLYAGYVKNVNLLMDKLESLSTDPAGNAPELAELRRRFGFEFNGMRLHEYYFEQLKSGGGEGSATKEALAAQYGDFDKWETDFKAVGKLRGVGWALVVKDEKTGNLHNVWVSDHELGHLGGQKVILAMDIWEHAFLLDYLPSQRGEYIDAFLKNLDWSVIDGRLS